jgi:hypothetical protein
MRKATRSAKAEATSCVTPSPTSVQLCLCHPSLSPAKEVWYGCFTSRYTANNRNVHFENSFSRPMVTSEVDFKLPRDHPSSSPATEIG